MKTFEEKYVLRKDFEVAGGSNESPKNIDNTFPNVPKDEHDNISKVTHKEITPIKIETIQAQLTKLEKTNPDLYKKLMDSGILKNTIENTDQLEKFSKYLSYLNYLYNVTRVSETDPSETSQEISTKGKQEIVIKYRELLSEKTDFIEDKEFLQYKYMDAIIRDIKRMGYFVQKEVNGDYVIKNLRDGKKVDKSKIGKYADVFKISSINNHAIDTALLANVIVSNKEFEGVLNQKQFINKLFQKYNIIANIKDDDKTNYLIVNEVEISKEISDKLSKSKSGQEISELSILQNFVTNKTWEDNSSYDRFNKANTYAKGFLKEKAFIDAYKSGKLPGLDDPKKSTEDKIADIIRNNRLPAAMLGVVAWLMGFKKTGLGAIGFGLFGGAAADLLSSTTKVGKDLINGNDSLIKPIEKDQIATILSETEYQDKYQDLVKFNSKIDNGDLVKSGDVYIDNSMEQLDSKRLNQLIEYIVTNGIDLDLGALNISDQLKLKLAGTTDKEIDSLIKLFKKSGIKEEGDKTILDYLTDGGRDKLNRPFDPVYPTGVDAFDSEITSVLKNEFDKDTATRDQKKKILELKGKISSEFGIKNIAENKANDLMSGSSLSSNKAVDKILSYVQIEFPTLETSLKPIFENYEKYEKANDELKGFEGLYDENILDLQSKIQGIFKTQNLSELYKKADNKIKKLESIKISDPLGSEEPFVLLNSKIDTLVSNLEKSKKELLIKAKENGVDIKDNGIVNPEEVFKTNPEKLLNDMNERLEAIKKASNDVKADKDFKNISDELEKIKDDYKILNIYSIKLASSSVNLRLNSMKQVQQQNIINVISIFNTEKIKLEKLVKAPLEEFYKNNTSALNKIRTLDTNVNTPTKVETAINQLENTREFLNQNGIEIGFKEKVEKEIEQVKGSIKVASTTSTTITGSIKNKVDEYLVKIGTFFDTTGSNISQTYASAKAELGVQIAELNKYAADNGLTTPDTTKIENSLDDLFKVKNKDEEAKKVLDKAKEVFGSTFEIRDGTVNIEGNTVKKVQEAYGDKLKALNTGIKKYLNGFTVENTSIKLKEQAKLLKSIKENFGLLDGSIEKTLDKVATKYIEITNVKDDTEVIKYINDVYNYTGNDSDILNKVKEFKKVFAGGLTYIITMNIKSFVTKCASSVVLKNDINKLLENLDIYK